MNRPDCGMPLSAFEMRLQTQRLSLREFTLKDSSALARMHRDERVRRLLIDDIPLHKHSVSSAFIRRLLDIYREYPGLGIWCAERRAAVPGATDSRLPEVLAMFSDQALAQMRRPRSLFAGWFNLMPLPDHPEEIELGSRLLPEAWGIGLALEGGELLLNHAFDTLELDRVWIACHIGHRPAHYIASALGFQRYGIYGYCKTPAQYYRLEKQHWQHWKRLTRKQKIRHGVYACKTLAHDTRTHATEFLLEELPL